MLIITAKIKNRHVDFNILLTSEEKCLIIYEELIIIGINCNIINIRVIAEYHIPDIAPMNHHHKDNMRGVPNRTGTVAKN